MHNMPLRRSKAGLSLFLSLVLVFGGIPTPALAEMTGDLADDKVAQVENAEDVELEELTDDEFDRLLNDVEDGDDNQDNPADIGDVEAAGELEDGTVVTDVVDEGDDPATEPEDIIDAPEDESSDEVDAVADSEQTIAEEAPADDVEAEDDPAAELEEPELTAQAATTTINFGTKYTYTLGSKSDYRDYYFTLDKAGRVKLSGNFYWYGCTWTIRNSNGNTLSSDHDYTTRTYNDLLDGGAIGGYIDLRAGTYFIRFASTQNSGKFEFTATFTAADESFADTGANDNVSGANTISVGKAYKGQIAANVNGEPDWYKFTIPTSGLVTLNLKGFTGSSSSSLIGSICDEDGYETGVGSSQDLVAGTYLIYVGEGGNNNASRTGNYTFSVSFTSANESFKESKNNLVNNDINSASSIQLNTLYKGQIAENDPVDWYKFTVPSSNKGYVTTVLRGPANARYTMYDSGHNQVTYDTNLSYGNTVSEQKVNVSSGTYYLKIEDYSSSTGNYSITVWNGDAEVSLSKVKVGGIANKYYSGSSICPKPKLTYGGATLKLNKDYTLTYKNNKAVGTASIIIKAKSGSGYKGSRTITFKIKSTAGGTWKKSNGKWWYQAKDGGYPKSQFAVIGGKTYYFDKSGYMLTGMQTIGGYTYYFGSNGALVKGWVQDRGKWYYASTNGRLVKNAWRTISKKRYRFASDGRMLIGVYTIGGYRYLFNDSGAMVKGWGKYALSWYYADSNGHLLTSTWKTLSGKRYYFKSDGRMAINWVKFNGKYYHFFGKDGAERRSTWVQYNSKWYYVNSKGRRVQNAWVTIDGKRYHFNKNGVWDK